jgi:hypothetical protein
LVDSVKEFLVSVIKILTLLSEGRKNCAMLIAFLNKASQNSMRRKPTIAKPVSEFSTRMNPDMRSAICVRRIVRNEAAKVSIASSGVEYLHDAADAGFQPCGPRMRYDWSAHEADTER